MELKGKKFVVVGGAGAGGVEVLVLKLMLVSVLVMKGQRAVDPLLCV